MGWLTVPLLLLVVVIVAGGLAYAARSRPRPTPEPDDGVAPQHPIALLHGAFGFDEILVREQRHAYFHGVADRLQHHGIVVHKPVVHPVAGIHRRATQLAKQLRTLEGERVHLIAHSMGGLDARYAITKLGLADRVASLVTIGTPHHGTPLANMGNTVARSLGLRWLLVDAGDMLADLTTERMIAFNRDVPDVPGVFYASVVGRIAPTATDVHPLLAPGHAFIKRKMGDNDGIIPTSSQEWGEVLLIVDADHWAQVGWSGSVDTPAIYEAIARELRRRGL